MMDELQFEVTDELNRLDKAIAQHFPEFSRSQIQGWVKEGNVYVNGESVKSNYQTKKQDDIRIQRPEPQELALVAEDLPLTIIYEDQDVVVVNKPQGMVVHPSAGHPNGTLVNALLYHCSQLSSINDVIRPGIVHRIDKDTSGLLMVAKNNQAHESLAKQLKEKTSKRQYIALVHGVIPHERGKIDAPIGRSKTNRKSQAVIEGGKEAVTHFRVLDRFAHYTLVECVLETGRTHQIRVHMDYIGYPLVGDPLYGPRKTIKGEGQFLHAKTLGFHQPSTGEWLEFSAPLPSIFQQTLLTLEK